MDDKFSGLPFGIRDTREEAEARKDAKRAERENPKHLAWIRNQPCIIGSKCSRGKSEAHHEPPRGKRTEWSDESSVPLCKFHHGERHSIGKTRFELRYRINFERTVADMVALRGKS